MSISNRIVLGFAAITGLLILLGIYATAQVGAVRETIDTIVTRDLAVLDQLDKIEAAQTKMVEYRTAAVRWSLTGVSSTSDDPVVAWRGQIQAAQDGLAALHKMVRGFAATPVTGEREQQWREMGNEVSSAEQAFARVRGDVEAQLAAIRAGNKADMLAREPTIVAERREIVEKTQAIRDTAREAVQMGQAEGTHVYERSRLSIIACILVAVGVSLFVAWAIRRSIVGPLGGFMAFTEKVGAGDLTTTAAAGPDELGRLGGQMNAMVDGLRGIARQSRTATTDLNAAATEIRASTQQQAASVEEQLAAIQETAATVDEITHSGTQISRRAQEVIAAAQETAQTTEAGIVAIEGTVRAMDLIGEQAETVASNIVQLSEKTQAIGDIIGTVNDISERAHLLALNAAIEAAAAGEQGRSFAIVAAELKNLADQAKDSTRQVRNLLGEIQRGINSSVMLTEEAVKRVAAGKERTDTAQATIEEMSGRIQESVQTFQQIVASTNQQQIGIEQVTLALQNIRQASQQTAASTRQLDQAAGDLSTLSQTLLSLADRYQV